MKRHYDRRAAVKLMLTLDPQRSDKQLATWYRVSTRAVAIWRSQLEPGQEPGHNEEVF